MLKKGISDDEFSIYLKVIGKIAENVMNKMKGWLMCLNYWKNLIEKIF